jgi:Kef-type K+ transport system membrane component KefB
MQILLTANIVAVLVAAWATWELRLTTFRSRWDSPKTTALILFMLAAVLDSPWRAMSEASFSYTGRFYFFTVIGHVCYLAACASGLKYIYLRLLPDAEIGPFVRRRLVPAVFVASAIMVVTFTASPLTASMSSDHLYLVRPDGWLTIYWLTFYGTLATILLAGMYGLNRLRADPRSVQLNLLLTSLGLGALSAVISLVGLLSGHGESVRLFAWPLAYAAIAVGAVALVLSWRHRVGTMLQPRDN